MIAEPEILAAAGPRRIARWSGAVSIFVGVLVLFGWAFGFPALTEIVSGAVTMKANTALCFVLCGAAMWLLQMRGRPFNRAARVCAVIVGVIALLTLVEYVSGWNLGIDEVLFRDHAPAVGISHRGRMGPNTAICFALTAAALWLMSRPPGNARRPLVLSWLGTLVAAIGLFALLGYFAGLSIGYGWWGLTGMAIHTASLFVLLGAALLAVAWREAGMRWLIQSWLTAGFVAGLVLLVAVAAYAHRNTTALVEATAWVQDTHEGIAQIGELRGAHDEEQSGTRGFVITGDEGFLRLADNAIPRVWQVLRELRKLEADNASQQVRLAVLEKRFTERLELSEKVIMLRRTSGFAAAAQLIATGRGKALSDQIRAVLHDMKAEEERLLAARTAQSHAIAERTVAILPLGTVLSLVLLTSGLLRLNSSMAAQVNSSDALRESESRFRTMADAIPQLAFMAEPNGFVFWYNQRWYDYTGTTPEQMEGWGWQSVHDPTVLPRVMERWTGAIAAHEPFEMEFPLRGADGRFRWFLTRVFPLKDSEGNIVRWFGTNTDISQKREAEEQIRQLNAGLEQRISDRTAQLMAAVKEHEAFTYSVAHDLRAPLRAVDGFSRIMLNDYGERLDDEGRRLLAIVHSEALRMGQLIDDLLAFSRLGRQQMEPAPVDMDGLAKAVFENLAAHESARKLRLDLRPLPPARGEKSMIRQLWVNLIGNAIKFTKQREVGEIEIGTRASEQGDEPIYYIKDNGAGFDMRFADKLFGVFQRLHHADEFEGTGVGLAIVQRIVDRHGGRVWAESEFGKGATFFFTLPGSKL